MPDLFTRTIPVVQLRRLDFLLGESTGIQILHPPGLPTVQCPAIYSGTREDCERFLKIDFFCEMPGFGIDTYRALTTWSDKQQCYRTWVFCASKEEPMYMEGNLEDDRLVMVSDPWPMPWGLQRVRSVFTPLEDGGMRYVADFWQPEGYHTYCTITFNPLGAG
jgi:hypothetical protein